MFPQIQRLAALKFLTFSSENTMSTLQGTAKGNLSAIKTTVMQQLALGDKALASHFKLTFRNKPDMTLRIAATQIPEMMRHEIESFGHMGSGSNQQGNIKNTGQITATVNEYLDGKTAQFIADSIANKTYHDIDLALTPEDTNLAPIAEWEMLKCYFSSEATDVANEDISGTINFPLTITYNWIEKTK